MKKFSDRIGITKPKVDIQVESMDLELRNCLWNIFSYLLTKTASYTDAKSEEMNVFVMRVWHFFLKAPLDAIPQGWSGTYNVIRDYFFKAPWYEVYNILEFAANNYPTEYKISEFVNSCNNILESELSGYRFVGKQIAPITSKNEISEIEEALVSPFKRVNSHLENALKLLSDRKSPDYRNSIKESISAVEALCRIVVGKPNASLGDALDIIKKEGKLDMHGALREALDHLYGYTSSADGIRHAFSEEKVNADFEEAKFMLVTCSAFVNYLISKAAKAGIKIG